MGSTLNITNNEFGGTYTGHLLKTVRHDKLSYDVLIPLKGYFRHY